MSAYSLDHKLHIVCFLSFFTYLMYYLSIKKVTSKKPQPRVGLNLCYGYSSIFLSTVGVFHFICLSISYYCLLFMDILSLYSLLISLLLLILNVTLFLFLRNLFANLYFFKTGVYIKYFDGRFKVFYFEDINSLICKYRHLGKTYSFVKKDGSKAFLFHGFLRCEIELSSFIQDKLKQISKD